MIWLFDRFILCGAWFFARLTPFVAPRDQKQLYQNITHVLKITDLTAQKTFATAVRVSQIRIALETVLFLFFPKLFTIEIVEKKPVEFSSKSFLFITGHLGAWEIAGYYARKYAPRELFILAKPSRSRVLTKLLNWVRRRLKMDILWLDDPQLFRKMIQTLKAKAGLGFVMDQKPQGRIGPLVDFFGHPTEFVSGPATMIKKFDSDVWAIFAVRIPGRLKYRIHIEKVLFEPHAPEEVELTQTMAKIIERVIRLYPEQWTWNYKRWKNLSNLKS